MFTLFRDKTVRALVVLALALALAGRPTLPAPLGECAGAATGPSCTG